MADPYDSWNLASQPPLPCASIDGVLLTPGDRVRLKPKQGGDIFDLVLDGKVATIAAIEQDLEGQIHVAVTVDDDPGRDFGQAFQTGHRFFFKLDEVEPLVDDRSVR